MKIQNKFIVHCKTDEQAKKLIKAAYEQGYKWQHEDSIEGKDNEETFFTYYKEKTCYVFRGKRITFSNIDDVRDLWNMLYSDRMLVTFEGLEQAGE